MGRFASAHRVQIATFLRGGGVMPFDFVSAHRVQIATWSSRPITDGTTTLSQRTACRSQLCKVDLRLHPQQILCLSAPRADRNGKCAQSTACGFVECAVSR